MDIKIAIIIILVIFIIYHVFWKDVDLSQQPAKQVEETDDITPVINHRVKETVKKAGYHVEYNLHSDTVASFTKDKKDIYLCSSCVDKDKTDLEKLIYVGLHEVSHVICKSKDHTEEWKKIFKKLLYVAADLGYLQKSKIKG